MVDGLGGNSPSGLLSPTENQKIFKLLQRSNQKNQSLATAVVKFYLSDERQQHKTWSERAVGVACLTKDFGRKSYYIQIIDMEYYQQIWEQELYLEMRYLAPQTWFHMFESDHSQAALSFAEEQEAKRFRELVLEKIEKNKQRYASPVSQVPTVVIPASSSSGNGKKKRFNKADISGPDRTTFVHISGIKTDQQGGMQLVDNTHKLDPVLRKYLSIAGVDINKMNDREIEEAQETAKDLDIYGIIEEKKTQRRTQRRHPAASPPPSPYTFNKPTKPVSSPPPIPQRDPLRVPTSQHQPPSAAPPTPKPSPKPTMGSLSKAFTSGRWTKPEKGASGLKGSLHSLSSSSKPPPAKTGPLPAPPAKTSGTATAAPPPPPPPPPPPAVGGGGGPPPPPPPGPVVEGSKMPAPPSSSSKPSVASSDSSAGNRGTVGRADAGKTDLLADIRGWKDNIQLKKVEPSTEAKPAASSSQGVTEMMRKALGEFRDDIAISSSEDEDSDDWDSD